METVTPVALLAFLVFTLVNLVRFVRGRDWNGALTIVLGWIVGVVAVALFAASKFGEGYVVPGFGIPVGELSFGDLVLVGLVIASTAGAFNELRGAFDSSTSTAKPKLMPEHTSTPNNVVVPSDR